MSKLFVGNLNFQTTEDELSALFSSFGKVVEVKLAKDKITKKARGFGFVKMQNEDSATEALKQLNGQLFKERKLAIDWAKSESKA
ncbi:MAG: RNA-binding protein [Chlamydiae bacterium]|jgi:cold-inducible RNA-binding protein|nr:RNA-binding protein [Chlamydiota bacterium]